MGDHFDWQDGDENWEQASPPASTKKVTMRKRPYRWLIIISIMAVTFLLAGQQLERQVDDVSVLLTSDLLASQAIVRQASAADDFELFHEVVWHEFDNGRRIMTQAEAGLWLDREPLGLHWQPALAEDGKVDLSPDLKQGLLTFTETYALNHVGMTETIRLQFTANFRYGQNVTSLPPIGSGIRAGERPSSSRWLLLPQEIDSEQGNAAGQFISVNYSMTDAEVSQRLARDLDDVLRNFCQTLFCPADFHLDVTLTWDPHSLMEMGAGQHSLQTAPPGTLRLPEIGMVGRPVDEKSYQALLRGYLAAVLSAVALQLDGEIEDVPIAEAAWEQVGYPAWEEVMASRDAVHELHDQWHQVVAEADVVGFEEIALIQPGQEQWARMITNQIAKHTLYQRPFLSLSQITETASPILTLDADLTQAQIQTRLTYTVTPVAELDESVDLIHTTFFQRDENGRWLLTSPSPDYWGKTKQYQGAFINLTYPEQDETIVLPLARQFDDILLRLCSPLRAADCPPVITLEMVTTPGLTLETVMIGQPWLPDEPLIMPTPSLIGLPINPVGSRMLLRGYAQPFADYVLDVLIPVQEAQYKVLNPAIRRQILVESGLLNWPLAELEPDDFAGVLPVQSIAVLCYQPRSAEMLAYQYQLETADWRMVERDVFSETLASTSLEGHFQLDNDEQQIQVVDGMTGEMELAIMRSDLLDAFAPDVHVGSLHLDQVHAVPNLLDKLVVMTELTWETPNGRYRVDAIVLLHDWRTGQTDFITRLTGGLPVTISLSPGGRWLNVSGYYLNGRQETLQIFDLANNLERVFTVDGETAVSVDWSADDKWLLFFKDGLMELIDTNMETQFMIAPELPTCVDAHWLAVE